MITAKGWTIPEAVAEFAKAGMPVYEDRFRIAVTKVARLPRIGETKPDGPNGGRGRAVYEIGELQRLHSRLAEWLVIREPPPGGVS